MPKYMPEKRFSFFSNAASMDPETFGVVQFSGIEGISLPYEFEIMLVSDSVDIDLDEVMAYPVKFTIHRKDGDDVDFHGILDSFDQLHKYNEYVFYRAHLVPRLWWLSITHHNQVCLNKTVPDIIALALKDSGLTTLDFEFKLQDDFTPVEYACQYNESHFNFISRWLEREGIYYYFDQSGLAEKLVFTNNYIAHTSLPDVFYVPPSGLLEDEDTEVVNSFTCRQRQLPQKIFLKDYNYERPSLGISGSADVDTRGRGIDYIYGEHFPSSEEGNRLATIRAEILNCRRRLFIGESTVPFLEPGYTITLNGHYRESFNQRYLVESVTHEGNQMGYLIPEVAEGVRGYKQTIFYRNSFTAIPADVQFRAERKAVKPHIAGSLHAKIDAEGSGQYAVLDNQGRYRVRLPFDESDDHKSGKASTYLRMMQPYANQKGGMQFPLTKGTEVLLTFIDGDPDRPVIAGAVANPETPSPVTDKNQTESVIQTGGNNKIRMEDKKGKERIIMESPTAGSWVRIGAPNDPPVSMPVVVGDNITNYLDGPDDWKIFGNTPKIVTQSDHQNKVIYRLTKMFTVDIAKLIVSELDEGYNLNRNNNTITDINNKVWYPENGTISNGKQNFYRSFEVTLQVNDCKQISDKDPSNGIRIHSDGNLYLESNYKYGEYRVGINNIAVKNAAKCSNNRAILECKENFDTCKNNCIITKTLCSRNPKNCDNSSTDANKKCNQTPPQDPEICTREVLGCIKEPFAGDLLSKFNNEYNPTGLKHRQTNSEQSFSDVIKNAHVRVSSLDTINTQEGNIYDFGGYWNYNMGNSYKENFIEQNRIKLNAGDLPQDRAGGGPGQEIRCNDICTIGENTAVNLQGYIPGSDIGGDFHRNLLPGSGKTLDPAKTWVEKTIDGAKYNYTKGTKTLSVEYGTVEESHVYGKSSYEYKYTGDLDRNKLVSKSHSQAGHSEEWKYDRTTGVILSHDKVDWLGVGGVILASSFAMTEKQKFSFNVSAIQNLDISIGECLNVDFHVGLDFGLKFNFSAGLKFDFGASGFTGLKAHWGGENLLDLVTLEWSGGFSGLKAQKEAYIKTQVQNLYLKKQTTGMSDDELSAEKHKIQMKAASMSVNTANITFLG